MNDLKDLKIVEANEADIPELTHVMTRAFDDDARKHLGLERGGPPGYDNGDFFREWMLPYQESTGYVIKLGSQVIGGLIVWILPHRENILGTIFVDPDYQDQGVGTRAWQYIEDAYPDTVTWTLETPGWATKNHTFYEVKCGFQKIKEQEGPEGISYVYRKIMGEAA
jgi:GNAT superfamily N-acetyltransferase